MSCSPHPPVIVEREPVRSAMTERLTGDAAWKAAKERVARSNEATHARARSERAAREEAAAVRRLAAEREERRSRPVQPGR
jgi:hypothetical protein